MTMLLNVKLTPSEVKILDWLMTFRLCESRSAAMRDAMYAHAYLHQTPTPLIKKALRERAQLPPAVGGRRRLKSQSAAQTTPAPAGGNTAAETKPVKSPTKGSKRKGA